MNPDAIYPFVKMYTDEITNICEKIISENNLASKEELRLYRSAQSIAGKTDWYLKDGSKYIFHGRGCRFTGNELKISWDFGYNHHWCGLDPWKLHNYLIDNHIENPFKDGSKIKEMFKQLVDEGKMEIKYDLYYIKEKCGSHKKK